MCDRGTPTAIPILFDTSRVNSEVDFTPNEAVNGTIDGPMLAGAAVEIVGVILFG
jgi:hypothetical protein